MLSRCLNRGVVYGAFLGGGLFVLSGLIPMFMTQDPAVRSLATHSLWIAAVALPIASVAYMLDGVLIGAGDTRKLATYMLAALAVFTPASWAVKRVGGTESPACWRCGPPTRSSSWRCVVARCCCAAAARRGCVSGNGDE